MPSESIIWHELGNEKPFISIAAISNQINESLVLYPPNSMCLLLKDKR